jgi:hypothetical protein
MWAINQETSETSQPSPKWVINGMSLNIALVLAAWA